MTIPRIGNKIVRIKDIPIQKGLEQTSPVSEVLPVEYEDVSLDEMFSSAEEYTNISNPQSIQTSQKDLINKFEIKKEEQIEQKTSNFVGSKEDEYSIEKFTNDYMERLHGDVLPMLGQYEPERKQCLVLAVISGIICASIGLYFLIFTNFDGRISGLFFGLAGLVWYQIKKNFEHKVKKKIMPLLMKAVPDFYWQTTPPITVEDIADSQIFPYDKNCAKSFDDSFLGKYRGVEISIAECTYTCNKKKVFSGAVIKLKMNKFFDGMTIIRPKKNVEVKNVDDLKKSKLQKIELEDVEFNKSYDVYSTDQIEARYLLTTSFMERFKNISLAFDSRVSFCSFQGKYVYIAPYCKKDLFNICSLVKNVTDEGQFLQLFQELTSILELVDYFKLDKKLGL